MSGRTPSWSTAAAAAAALGQLEALTNFNKRELQVLYRGFKNVRRTASTTTMFSDTYVL